MMLAEIFVGADLKEGTSGKASRATPTILKRVLSQVTVTQSLSSFLKLTGASGSNLAISKSFLACTQMDPGVEMSSASMSQRIVTSRSVPVRRIVFSPTDSIRMLERTGIVFFFSTTPWTKPNSFWRFCLLTTNCMFDSLSLAPSLKAIIKTPLYFLLLTNTNIYLFLAVVVGPVDLWKKLKTATGTVVNPCS